MNGFPSKMVRGVKNMVHKRIKSISIVIMIGIFLLIGRLVHIQLWKTESFTKNHYNLIEESVKQRTQEVIIDNGRGKFYDRNLKPLTHESVPTLVLFPFLKHMNWDVEKVASIINVQPEELVQAIENAKEPVVFGNNDSISLTKKQMEEINNLKIPGVFAVDKQWTQTIPLASQLIGITGQNVEVLKQRYPERNLSKDIEIGISGLQKSFDEFLVQDESTKLVYHVDGLGGPLFGIDVKLVGEANPFYPVKVLTTIDRDIQKEAENLVDKHNIKKGGLVLIDIETNSILANVSRPKIDEKDPYKDNGVKNYMISTQIPGSIFKTVIAAAAIDYGLVSESRLFNCSQTITGEPDPVFQHGELDFKDSFSRSCNFTFGQLARELNEIDSMIIENYAEKLGLTSEVGWNGDVFHLSGFKQLSEEEIGQVYGNDEERYDKNYAALSGIGQNNVRISPLAAANMMATIARGGEKQMVRAVQSIQYKNGTTMYLFPQKKLKGDTLKPYTVMKLQELLKEVVDSPNGTAHALHSLPYQVAGKSGTAELNQFKDGKQLHNKWFIGYFPFEKPKYALAVVNLDVFSNEGSVLPLFADMVNYLYQYDQTVQSKISPLR